jgi:hypothetical protein
VVSANYRSNKLHQNKLKGDSKMDSDKLTLGSADGDVTIEIFFGYAQIGSFVVNQSDGNGSIRTELASGDNVKDQDVEVVTVGPVTNLNGKIISWTLVISAADDSKAGQFYSATVSFRQGGNIVSGGTWQKTGPLQESKALYGAFTIAVV